MPQAEAAPDTGTTIVAVTYAEGVVLGADSRVSTGNYVSNRASDKLTPLHDSIWLLRSGSAADTQLVADYVRYYTNQLSMELTDAPDVKSVASLVKQLNYSNKSMLLGAMIIAGYDARSGGQVWGCPISGTLVREKWAIDGSGSTYLWGYLDSEFREGLSRAEAERLVTDALSLAMARDGSSGGLARLVTIDKDGVTRQTVKGTSIPLYWDELEPNGHGMVIV